MTCFIWLPLFYYIVIHDVYTAVTTYELTGGGLVGHKYIIKRLYLLTTTSLENINVYVALINPK